MSRMSKGLVCLALVTTLFLPFVVLPAVASLGGVEYDVKSFYRTERFEQHTEQVLTKGDKPTLVVKTDFSQAGLFKDDTIFEHYRPKGQEYPEYSSFVILQEWLPEGEEGWKKCVMWGYDMYYQFKYNNALHEIWEIVGYVHIPELEMPKGPLFTIQFSVGNRYRYKSPELPFEEYYGEQAQRHIEADLLQILSKVSVSFETAAGSEIPPGGSSTVTTQAGNQAGDDASASADIPAAVAVGLVATAAAVAGAAGAGASAGAAGGSASGKSGQNKQEEQTQSRLRMIISKNFGQFIRYGDEHVFVYARIVELFDKGGQQDRPDLTAQIRISTQSACLDLGPARMAGDSMGAAVRAPGQQGEKPAEATISFALAAGEGSFTNHVVFKMMDWAEIKVADSCILVESIHGQPDATEVPYELLNFMDFDGANITLEMKDKTLPFTITLEAEGPHKGKIMVANDGSRQDTTAMFSNSFGKLRAKSSKDEAEKDFMVVTCRDGLYLDFGEHEKAEIRCYKEPDSDEMEITRVLVGLARFDRQARRLTVIAPDAIEMQLLDKHDIGKKIGIELKRMPKAVKGRFADNQLFADFRLAAKKPLPYHQHVAAELDVSCQYNDEEYFRKFPVALVPDIIWYYDEFDKQYEALHKRVIDSFSPDIAKHYTHQLDILRTRLGLADLQSYERYLRDALQVVLEQSATDALATADNWDMAVSALEWTAYVGDISADLLMAAFTGPVGVILADGGKELIVEVARRMLNDPNFSSGQVLDIAWDKLMGSLTKNITGFVEFPKPPAYGKIAIWMTVFTVYRIFWHWEYDLDAVTGKPLGLENACKMAMRDVLLETALKAGLEQMLRSKADAFKSSAAQTAVDSVYAVDNMATEAMQAFVAFLNYASGLVDSAAIAAVKAIGIV